MSFSCYSLRIFASGIYLFKLNNKTQEQGVQYVSITNKDIRKMSSEVVLLYFLLTLKTFRKLF